MADEIKNEDTNEVLPTTSPEEVSGESLTESENKEQEIVASPEEEKVSETQPDENVEEPSKEVDPDAEYDYHKRG